MAQRRGNNGGGRRSKGERKLLGTRVALAEARAVEERAAARDIPVSDYLAELIQEHLRRNPEERLDISA
jgi:hypothetical protein